MLDFSRLEERHHEIASSILDGRQRATPLALAARAAFKTENSDDIELKRRTLARAASEIEIGVWKAPEKCTREIAMHIVGDMRHQKLLADKVEVIAKEKARGAHYDEAFEHLTAFERAIVKPMLRFPEAEEMLKKEAVGEYEVLDPGEQVKLRADFEDGTYLTTAEIHRIGLELENIPGISGARGFHPDQGMSR